MICEDRHSVLDHFGIDVLAMVQGLLAIPKLSARGSFSLSRQRLPKRLTTVRCSQVGLG
jgi:hypothetical protein